MIGFSILPLNFNLSILKVSVIIPVYNAADFLEFAVQSALQQKEVEEIILVEDASTDESFNIAKKLTQQFPKVQLYRHPGGTNLGAGASRNLGIQKASMEFIAFLDADDFYLEKRFEVCQTVFEKFPNALGVYEAVDTQFQEKDLEKEFLQNIKGKKLTTIEEDLAPDVLFDALLQSKKGWWHLNGFTIKKALIEQIGFFDEQLRQTQDSDFHLRSSLTQLIYPGSRQQAVAVRRIHKNNRILNRATAIKYKRAFYRKWYFKMLTATWSKSSNRFLFNTHLSYHPEVFNRKFLWSKRIIKILLAFVYLFRYPKLWIKLF